MSLYAQFGYPLPVTQPVTKVLLADGSYGTIEKVRDIHYDTPQTTYNFEVEDYHTYYVGTGVLVHNKCKSWNADSYEDALAKAKEFGGVSGQPEVVTPNQYGGNDLTFYRRAKSGKIVEVTIKEHMTGHPNRGIARHLNVIDTHGQKWHIFF